MSENNTPERIDLDELAVEQRNPWLRSLLREASRYQEHLEADNWSLTADLAEVRLDYGEQVESRDTFARQAQELERERDGLNRDQTELAARVDELKAQLANQATVPRVITADELKPGQRVAAGHDGLWRIIEVGDHIEEMDWAEMLFYFGIYAGDTIVLLPDAPAEEPVPVKVGDTISGEEELDGLAHDSVVLDRFGDAHQKADHVWWAAVQAVRREAAGMLPRGPFTVLYLPEEDA